MTGTTASTPAARSAFLARLRGRLANGNPPNPIRPIVPLAGDPPEVAYSRRPDDLAAAFTKAATAATATVRTVTRAGVADLVAEMCGELNAQRVALSADPECDGLAELVAGAGLAVVPRDDRSAMATVDLGITGAAYGIALTGTLVVDSGRAGSRTVSLLPPAHLALLSVNRLVPTAGDLLRHLGERMPDGLPSNMVFITGPSRSGDIELYMALGVHGPRTVWIGLIDD